MALSLPTAPRTTRTCPSCSLLSPALDPVAPPLPRRLLPAEQPRQRPGLLQPRPQPGQLHLRPQLETVRPSGASVVWVSPANHESRLKMLMIR